MVLVNALTLKANWEKKFESTAKDEFDVNDRETINVDMMNITSEFKYQYSKELSAQVISLNFKVGKIAFLPPYFIQTCYYVEERENSGL